MAPAVKDVRNWCRDKFGAKWWDVDKAIKKERMSNARKALSGKPPNLPESATAPKQPNPFKPTYLLKMRWSYSNEETIERITPIDPAMCIDPREKSEPYRKIGPREEGGAGGALYLVAPCSLPSEWEDEEDDGIYFGEHPLPGYGSSDRIRGFAEEGDTSDVLGQKLVRYKLDCPLVIDQVFWADMKPATQEAILRDSSATQVFLCDAQF